MYNDGDVFFIGERNIAAKYTIKRKIVLWIKYIPKQNRYGRPTKVAILDSSMIHVQLQHADIYIDILSSSNNKFDIILT